MAQHAQDWPPSTAGGIMDDYATRHFEDLLPTYSETDTLLPYYPADVNFSDALQQSGVIDLQVYNRSVTSRTAAGDELYHLSKALDSVRGPISFYLVIPPGLELDGSPRNAQRRELYRLSAFPFEPLSRSPYVCRIQGHTDRGCFGRCALYFNSGVAGHTAEVVVEGKPALRYAKKVWRDSKGKILATEEKGDSSSRGLKIVEGIEPRMRDLLVASACARVWTKSTAATFGQEISMSSTAIRPSSEFPRNPTDSVGPVILLC
ncbi:MAG: hypothetical protein M1814_003574 [Vezdaea aestivalis]|nr:MAG: hypothetical protein M1814_003574 [Vezdaea aestivalis]